VKRSHAMSTAKYRGGYLRQILASREIGGGANIAFTLAGYFSERINKSAVEMWIPGKGAAWRAAETLGFALESYASEALFAPSRLVSCLNASRMVWRMKSPRRAILHFHSPFVYGALRPYLRWMTLRTVVHIHSDFSIEGLRWAFKVPPNLIVTCAKYLEGLVERSITNNRILPWRLVTIPNSVNTSRYKPGDKTAARQACGITGNVPVIAMVANLSARKGQETVIRALASVRASGVPATCLLIGNERHGESTYGAHLHRLVDELGLSGCVRFLGFRENVPEILRAADILVLPSLSEGLPLSILEAQASKVAVVASPVGGIPEVVTHGETGLLIEAHDTMGYARSMERLILDRNLYSSVVERAYRQILEQRSTEVFCRRFWKEYEGLDAGPTRTNGDCR